MLPGASCHRGMTRLFDWKRVRREVKVLEPQFFIREEDKLKTIVVYAKMCRGAMTRYILQNRLTTKEELTAFSYEESITGPKSSTRKQRHCRLYWNKSLVSST